MYEDDPHVSFLLKAALGLVVVALLVIVVAMTVALGFAIWHSIPA